MTRILPERPTPHPSSEAKNDVVLAWSDRLHPILRPTRSGFVPRAVALFKLYRVSTLDAFRLTLPGKLLLGRVFSLWDMLAYAVAIIVGALLDRVNRATS